MNVKGKLGILRQNDILYTMEERRMAKDEKKKDSKRKKNKNKKNKEKNILKKQEGKLTEKMDNDSSKQNVSIGTKIINLITVLGGGVVYSVLKELVNNYVQMSYQTECSQFYGIPYKYFSVDVEKGITAVVLSGLLLFMIFGYKYFFKKVNDEIYYKILSFFLDICFAFSYTLVVLQGVIVICEYIEIKNIALPQFAIDFLYYNTNWFLAIVVGAAIVTVLVFNNNKILQLIKNKILRTVATVLVMMAWMISILIFVAAIYLCMSNDVTNKCRYETFSLEEKDYVVLNEKDGRVLIVEYYESKDKVIFFTNSYKVVDNEGIQMIYEDWKVIPDIEPNMDKNEYMQIQYSEEQ